MNAPLDIETPWSQQAEQSLLGALLLDNTAIDVAGHLEPADCYHGGHQEILRHILRLIAANKPADILTVLDSLQAAGRADYVGGLAYLGELANSTPGASNIGRYAEIVREKASLRRLQAAGGEIQALVSARDGMSVSDKVQRAQALVMDLAEQAGAEQAPKLLGDVLPRWMDRFKERMERQAGTVAGIPTGIAEIDRRFHGVERGRLYVIAGRPGMGKAQPLTAQVLMSDGTWRLMRDVSEGDYVASVDGRESRVVGVFPQGERDIFSITFSDGRVVEADAEHLWDVSSSRWPADSRQRTVTTAEIARLLNLTRYKNRVVVRGHSGEFGSRSDLLFGVSPWLLGFLLGDGCLTSRGVRFSNPERYIIDRVETESGLSVLTLPGGRDHYIRNPSRGKEHPLRAGLQSLGVADCLAHEKRIPSEVFLSTKAVRLQVLAGLLESDGWVEKFNSVQFSSASKELSDGVVALVRSLGGRAYSRVKRNPKYSYKGETRTGRDAYVVTVGLSALSGAIKSPRLLSNLSAPEKPDAPVICSVSFSRKDYAQCIKVSHPSSLYITDGYTVTHNTTIALNIAEQIGIDGGEPVLICSQEMPDVELAQCFIASIGRIDKERLNDAQLTDAEFDRLTFAASKAADAKIMIDEQAGLSMSNVRTKARQAQRQMGRLGLIVIDYLQLMVGEGDSQNEKISGISRECKALAREFDCPVFLLSQLNRECEKRPNRRPVPSDLRDSGAIEQDADVIWFVYRDEVYNEDSPDKGCAELICAKHRMGGQNGKTTPLIFHGQYGRFESLEGALPSWSAPREEPKRRWKGMD